MVQHISSLYYLSLLFQISYDNGICQLTIQLIDITDLGEYSCIASNEHGVDRTSARLITGGYLIDSFEI